MARSDTPGHTLYDTRIDIPQEARKELVALVNQQLADTADLHSQAKQAHWNVKGLQFQALHELFDAVAAILHGQVDALAERATALGGVALGTVRQAAANSSLVESPADAVTGVDYLQALRDRLAAYAASTRAASRRAGELGDPTSEDLFIEISHGADKYLYFLEAHLQA